MTPGSIFVRVRESVRTGLWFVPSLFVAGAIGLWVLMVQLDEDNLGEDLPLGFNGGVAGAREVLSAIATSMIAFTGVVFSVTIVALQLASAQYSPGVLRNFLRNRLTQAALGSFIATFVYALLVLRGVRSENDGDPGFVPRLSVSVAFLILGLSLVMFVLYMHEIAQSVRASRIVDRIGRETREVLEHHLIDAESSSDLHDPVAPAPRPQRSDGHVVLKAETAGTVLAFDTHSIVTRAQESEVLLRAAVMPGDFVAHGMPMLLTVGGGHVNGDRFRGTVALGPDRTMEQDVRLGFRQLVDIALRALSPSLNDPTTAVQCLDQLHDLLRCTAPRRFCRGVHRDREGTPRFIEPIAQWDELLDLSVIEIAVNSYNQPHVAQRLHAMLDDLEHVALEERKASIRKHRGRVGAGIGS